VKLSLERKLTLGFGGALIVLLLVSFSASINARRLTESHLLVDHTHEVLNHLEQALIDVLTMQTNVRGFVLTGSEEMLQSYREGRAHLAAEIRVLRELTADNPTRRQGLDQVESLAARATEIMEERIAARREAGLPTAEAIPGFLESQRMVEALRRSVQSIEEDERRLLNARFAAAEAGTRANLATLIITGVLATALVGFAVLRVRYDVRLRREAEEKLRQFNGELEARIRERTLQQETTNRELSRQIAERTTAEEALRHSERRFRALIEHSADSVSLIDAANNILYLSPAVAAVEGYTAEELGGHNGLENTHPDDLPFVHATMAQLMANPAKPIPVLWRRRHKQGHWLWLEGVATNLLDDPAVRAIVTNYRDVTPRKQAEEQIRRLNSDLEERVARRTAQLEAVNHELEAFSYSVSHDLRAPLRHIDGFSSLLAKHVGEALDEKGRRYLATISNAARQMGRLIDDLLSFSRMGRADMKLQEIDHDALVAGVIREGRFANEALPIEWKIAPLPRVRADAAMLRQVWFNLIDNAVKYSGKRPQPRIEIGWSAVEGGVGLPPQVTPSSQIPSAGPQSAAPTQLEFFVRDNGVGFDMTYVEKLFGVFQRLHGPAEFEGTGIGLANVRRIITRHGGQTRAEGRVGEGATFYFSLPLPAPPPSNGV
jgi:PAS domain S-box-containing protein